MGHSFIAHDATFADVTGPSPRLTRLATVDAHEGPVYVAHEHSLYYTSVPRPSNDPVFGHRSVNICRLQLDGRVAVDGRRGDVVVASANNANGMTRWVDGRLLVCEQGSMREHAAVSLIDPSTGHREVVIDSWRGLRFNSPNDVTVSSDGSVWFTDPSYGYLQGFRPPPMLGDYVYRVDTTKRTVTVASDGFSKPNGLAFSPDGSRLYVADSGAIQAPDSFHPELPHRVEVFDVGSNGMLSNRRLFAVIVPGFPDGLKTDASGRVYVSCARGVQVYSPDAVLLGEIAIAGAVNFCFGTGGVLFITNDDAVWAASLSSKGVSPT
jgi:gluconolactonase